MKFRLILTGILWIVGWIVYRLIDTSTFIASGQIAGDQLQNSNAGALAGTQGARAIDGTNGWFSIAMVVLTALIWFPYLKRKAKTSGLWILVALLVIYGQPAQAFWSTTNASEPLGIPTNSTAFWIPDEGNTQAGQQQIDDASFYNTHTVPGKIFLVPHHVFDEPGFFSQDYYVPTGHLILVDRTPVSREWTASTSTGTSSGDESFTCQSNDGLNVKQIGVSISAFIQPQDAATYLYYYGTAPVKPNPDDAYMQANAASDPQGVNDPAVIFASELHATPLDDVMDTKIHSLVGIEICNQIGSGSLNQDNANYVPMMATIAKQVSTYLQTRGITLDYIGWDGTWTFDGDVQQAENNVYVAEETKPYLDVLMRSAEITAIQKWNGSLPNAMTLVGGLSELFGGIFYQPAVGAHK
jgi:hypothetical protein